MLLLTTLVLIVIHYRANNLGLNYSLSNNPSAEPKGIPNPARYLIISVWQSTKDTLFHAKLLKFIEENNPWIKTKFTNFFKNHFSSRVDFLSILFVFATAKIDNYGDFSQYA